MLYVAFADDPLSRDFFLRIKCFMFNGIAKFFFAEKAARKPPLKTYDVHFFLFSAKAARSKEFFEDGQGRGFF